jgi:hypothetical protein
VKNFEVNVRSKCLILRYFYLTLDEFIDLTTTSL